MAFNSVSDELFSIAKQQMEKNSKGNTSLKALKTSSVSRYKDIRISINGTGYVFGDYDAFTNQKTYQYSLRASYAGSSCYLIERANFLKFCKQYAPMGEEVARTVYDKDMNMIRQLTRVVFNKWHSDLLQENLKVVPDLEPQKQSKRASENEDSGNAIW